MFCVVSNPGSHFSADIGVNWCVLHHSLYVGIEKRNCFPFRAFDIFNNRYRVLDVHENITNKQNKIDS